MEPIIELKNVTKKFGGITALDSASLHVDKGEVVGLIGDNGAGKSTLIKTLVGVHKPDDGEIIIKGKKVNNWNTKKAREAKIETVFQDRALTPQQTIVWNIFMGKELRHPLGFVTGTDQSEELFPVAKTQTEDKPKAKKSEPFPNCPGCRGHQSSTDSRHTRVLGECRFPDTESIEWSCPGCKKNKPAGHEDHTYVHGECKQVSISSRGFTDRKGRHPRPPTQKATKCPTADAQAQLPDGSDLGQSKEEATEEGFPPVQHGGSSSSGSPPSRHGQNQNGNPQTEDERSADASIEDAASSTKATRGSDKEPRVRRTYQDAGSGIERPADWSRFDVTQSLRALRSNNKAVQLRELRKLHLRWWHAPAKSMTNLIKNAGLSQEVLKEIPNIINTCRECRAWQAKGKTTIPSVTLSTHFNEIVEFS